MSRIIPKLNLNKTPQLVENNSLVYAKNIKLSDDGVISPDTSLSSIYKENNDIKYKGYIVGLNNTVYIFKEDTTIDDSQITDPNDKVKIFKYNEITKDEHRIECAWKYSGGKIDGLVTTNNIGDEILTICEYDVVGINVPIKHINLNKSKDDTEESIYTQNPNVLLSNMLNVTPVEGIQIPNGVYQFFIRYEIRKDFYTNWMPCSKDIYVGKNQQNCTIQGSIRYVDTNYDSPTSFQFEIEHILDNINLYKKFQLGFILSSDDSVVARSWKHFNLYKEKRIITFDYDKSSIEEINIDDLLQTNYEIFNVKNITYFKNKEYISNYQESNFNELVNTDDVSINLASKDIDYTIDINKNKNINLIQRSHESKGSKLIKGFVTATTTTNKKWHIYYINNLKVLNVNGGDPIIDKNIIIQNYVTKFANDVYTLTDEFNNKYPYQDLNNNHIIPSNRFFFIAGEHWDYFVLGDINTNVVQNRFIIYEDANFKDSTLSHPNLQWCYDALRYCKKVYKNCIIKEIKINENGNNILTEDIYIEFKQIKQKVIEVLTNTNNLNQTTNGSNIIVNYSLINYSYSYDTVKVEDGIYSSTIKIDANLNNYKNIYNIDNFIDKPTDISDFNINQTTLMPNVNYEFYLHFVKKNGIITNGHKINNITNEINNLKDLPYYPTYTEFNKLQIIYPDINLGNINIPKDAKAWFISIYNPTNMTCRGFNFRQDDKYNYIECIEADALLHNLINNIPIYKQSPNEEFTLVSTKGEYLSSGQTKVVDYFGNTGVIRWPIDTNKSLTTFTNISSTIKIPITSDKISGNIHFNTNKHLTIHNENFAGDIHTIIDTIKDNILTSIPENYRNNNFYITVTFPDTTLPIIYDKEGLKLNNELITADTFYNINNENEITKTTDILEINEDEYNHNLKQLEIYNTAINNTNLAVNTRSNTFINTGSIAGCSINKNLPDKNYDVNQINTVDISDETCPSDIKELSLFQITPGTVSSSDLNDVSSNTANKLKIINDAITVYNNNLSKAKNKDIVKYVKDGKITYTIKEGIVSGKELLSLVKYISITISTKADDDGNNPISFIDFVYSKNQKTTNDIINIETKKSYLIKPVFAKSTKYSYWIINNTSNSTINNDNKKLTKITPFIPINITSYNDYNNMNLPAFLCLVEKPDYNINNKMYVNGTDVYDKIYDNDANDNSETSTIENEEPILPNTNIPKGVITLEKRDGYIPYHRSDIFATISNFNLNMLSLREDLTLQLRNDTIITHKEDENDKNKIIEEETIYNQTFKAINSLVVSSIYQLPTMYKDYIRKYYYITNEEDNIYKFDNTVRSSNVNVDESHINVYRFKAEDYYHVPANKGFIVKMFTILDNIYIHCQHALYNFVGANSLTSTEGNVALKETDVFDSGIKALLDSKNGFAGISEKHHGIVTYSSYIWYDALAKTIYSIDSQTGIKDISQSIKKLIHNYNINDVNFVADESNARFFVNFKVNNDSICLSYDFRNKDFISLHDLDFKEGFNTRSNTYLVSNTDESQTNIIYQLVPYIEYKNTDNNIIQDFIRYEKCYKQNLILSSDDKVINNNKGLVSASFDVICNENYETIKCLEYISWICGKIIKFNDDINFAEEHIDYTYPADCCRIYNELTKTNLIDLSSRSNDAKLDQNDNITKPRFNNGIWSLNYFRNINDNNIDRSTDTKLNYHTEDSLLYGKYFVVRFVFNNTNFKFENVTFNVNIYEQI